MPEDESPAYGAPRKSDVDAGLRMPLEGVRVIDLTTFLSGPFATQILGDLGAEVIKVETTAGDSSRHVPPHFVGDDSAYYVGINRNKRSVAVDLKNQDGLRIVRQLIALSDVVVENFRPDVCARLGLDVDSLRAENPDLVWASISGFGQTGPWRDRPAYDMIVQALSGVMSLTGEPGGRSVRLGVPLGDLAAGMFAVIGVLASLSCRDRDGGGRSVDVSMLDSQLSMLSYQAIYAMLTGSDPQPQGRGHDMIPTYRAFTASDGRELVITANTEQMWRNLCGVLEREDLPGDPRFVDAAARLERRDELWAILEDEFARRPAAEWVEELIKHQVPAALINSVLEALGEAEQAGRDMVVELSRPDGAGSVRVVGNPVKFPGQPERPPLYPPGVGQDTRAVLEEVLRLGDHEIEALRASGAIVVGEASG